MTSRGCADLGSLVRAASLIAMMSAGIAGTLTACSDSTPPVPSPFAGRYDLVAIDGQELPILVFAGIDGSTRSIVAGAIEFRSRGRLMDVRVFQTRSPTTGVGPLQTDSVAFAYEIAGDKLLIRHPMPFEPDSYVDTGTVAGAVLTIDSRIRLSFTDVHSAVGGRMQYVAAAPGR